MQLHDNESDEEEIIAAPAPQYPPSYLPTSSVSVTLCGSGFLGECGSGFPDSAF
jgi:hypothetical protein